MTTPRLDQAPPATRCRVVFRKAERQAVDLEARTIKGLSAITRGEALGHGLWIDGAFLEQVASSGKALAAGAKSRFTHPGMSSDGMGKHLGRAKAFALDGDKVRVDLHLARSASRSPEGDLAGYVLELANEDPQAFGASIVFTRDLAAEEAFLLANGAGAQGYSVAVHPLSAKERGFKSPDPLNTGNLPHARLQALHAVDLVDEPAANPDGLFSHPTFELVEGADEALAFVLGLTETAPPEVGGIDPERARGFVARFLSRRGLVVLAREIEMSNPNTGAATPAPSTPTTPAPSAPARKPASLGELRGAFPEDERAKFVLEQLGKEATIEEARAAFSALRISELEAENKALREKPAPVAPTATSSGPRGVPPVAFNGSATEAGELDLLAEARAYRDDKFPEFAGHRFKGMNTAIKAVIAQSPEKYARWRADHGIAAARGAK